MEQSFFSQQYHPTREEIVQWIINLGSRSDRAKAIAKLRENKDFVPDLGLLIWNSVGTMASLLQELTNTYPLVTNGLLDDETASTACKVVSILETAAVHPETRQPFINALLPLYIMPFLSTDFNTIPYRIIKEESLSLIVSMAMTQDTLIIDFLLRTNFVPTCMAMMTDAFEKIRHLASYFMLIILKNDKGLRYVCESRQRFSNLTDTLHMVVWWLAVNPCATLLDNILDLYLQLSTVGWGRRIIRQFFPVQLRNDTFADLFRQKRLVQEKRQKLLDALLLPPV